MTTDKPPLVEAAIARLVGDDPLAGVLIAAAHRAHPDSFDGAAAVALLASSFADLVRVAAALARSRRDRQHIAVIQAWRDGDRDRGRLLARQHLADFPEDVLISWLVGQR